MLLQVCLTFCEQSVQVLHRRRRRANSFCGVNTIRNARGNLLQPHDSSDQPVCGLCRHHDALSTAIRKRGGVGTLFATVKDERIRYE